MTVTDRCPFQARQPGVTSGACVHVLRQPRKRTLTASESWERLLPHGAGRLAVKERVGVFPMIIPVPYWSDGSTVIIATDAASALTAATHRSAVALQVEGTGPRRLDWWSVVIQGRADLLNPAEITLLVSPGDDTGTSRQRWVRIEVRRVMGESTQEAEIT